MTSSRNPNLGITLAPPKESLGERWQLNLGQSTLYLGTPRHDSWWTGLSPENCPGFCRESRKLHSLPIPNLASCSRQDVLNYFNNSWTLTELLFSALQGDEPFYRPPYHSLRHPLIFYYVHPAVLYVNKLRLAGLLDSPVDPHFESLFETGVDEMSWDDMAKNELEWPSIDLCLNYRSKVYGIIKHLIEGSELLIDGHAPILQDNKLWALFMGFEHERIHLETSSVLMRELPIQLLKPPAEWPALAPHKEDLAQAPQLKRDYPSNKLIEIPASTVYFGKDADWPCYGWDNEYGSRSSRLSRFQATQLLISNGEFWNFVAEGGYLDKQFWSEDGWKWRSFRNVKAPSFWYPDGPAGSNQFKLRTCFEIISMQWDWPAVVNFHEAQAYCKWKSTQDNLDYRLMTEAEHQALRHANKFDNTSQTQLIATGKFNNNLSYGSESSVELHTNEEEISDLFGNVWQWCEDHFNPLNGSRVHRYYDDFSTPCYDGQHQMILGGSFVSTGDEATPWARFHFRPHFFQHAGFRMVHSPDGSNGCVGRIGDTTDTTNPYETQDIFNEYMTLHFAEPDIQMPYQFGPKAATSFPQRCAEMVTSWCNKLQIKTGKALDIGCAVGGASFKLAERFDEVTGVDLSERFIDAAKELKLKKALDYNYKIEANIYGKATAKINDDVAARANFRQADACALPAEYLDFDVVLMANLLCRLPSPSACLSRMWGARGIVRVGGILVTVSPYTWMDKFTPSDVWLGGYKDDSGKECYSEDGLRKMLGDHFELLHVEDMPLIIREHRRKFQYIVSQAMVWQRKS